MKLSTLATLVLVNDTFRPGESLLSVRDETPAFKPGLLIPNMEAPRIQFNNYRFAGSDYDPFRNKLSYSSTKKGYNPKSIAKRRAGSKIAKQSRKRNR